MDVSQEPGLLEAFGIDAATARLEPMTQGYINDTFAVDTPEGRRFVLQSINTQVFRDYQGLMQNLAQALPYLQAPDYAGLELLRTQKGKLYKVDGQGRIWRVFRYLSGSYTLSTSGEAPIARESGRILGRFHQLMAEADPAEYREVLPRFHDLGHRMDQLEKARNTSGGKRQEDAAKALDLAFRLSKKFLQLPLEESPLRVCHNDAKLSNILFHRESGKALCLIDLDTLMPGKILYDMGDALRTLMDPAPEGEPSSATSIRTEQYAAFLEGLRESGLHLTEPELVVMADAAAYMPLLHGIRALTDYLLGDRYYKVRYADENLVRARNLLRTAEAVAQNRDALQEITQKVFPG